jgi:CRP-like cAMP-binding protein
VTTGNRLVDSFAAETRDRLRPYTQLVHLAKGQVLYEASARVRFAYFPTNGMLSLLATTEAAQTVEVAMVGAAGFAGVPIILPPHTSPYNLVVQIASDSLRVSADALLTEFERSDDLRRLLLHYVHGLVCEVSQSAVCHKFHSLPQRLCRWLLVSRDCVASNTIELTQDFIAQMLGLSRPKVSVALTALEDKQLIRQRHGRIDIKNAAGLESCSCECYRLLKARLREPIASAR